MITQCRHKERMLEDSVFDIEECTPVIRVIAFKHEITRMYQKVNVVSSDTVDH